MPNTSSAALFKSQTPKKATAATPLLGEPINNAEDVNTDMDTPEVVALKGLLDRLDNIEICIDGINAQKSQTVCPNVACSAVTFSFALITAALLYGMLVTGLNNRIRAMALETNPNQTLAPLFDATSTNCSRLGEKILQRCNETTGADVVMYALAGAATILITAYSAYIANEILKRHEQKHITNVFTDLTIDVQIEITKVLTANDHPLKDITRAGSNEARLVSITTALTELAQLKLNITNEIHKVRDQYNTPSLIRETSIIRSLSRSGV